MEVAYTQKAKEDIAYWKSTGNKQVMAKISTLVTAIAQNPFEGIGKPEPLKYGLTGSWSRRINQEHRIVYEVLDDRIVIHSLKGHYF
jgi:toxin YoeB